MLKVKDNQEVLSVTGKRIYQIAADNGNLQPKYLYAKNKLAIAIGDGWERLMFPHQHVDLMELVRASMVGNDNVTVPFVKEVRTTLEDGRTFSFIAIDMVAYLKCAGYKGVWSIESRGGFFSMRNKKEGVTVHAHDGVERIDY